MIRPCHPPWLVGAKLVGTTKVECMEVGGVDEAAMVFRYWHLVKAVGETAVLKNRWRAIGHTGTMHPVFLR